MAYGVVLKTGLNYFFDDHLFVDLFVDYLYQPVNFHSKPDISGFKPGIGIGYHF